jgi:hypothetical protein
MDENVVSMTSRLQGGLSLNPDVRDLQASMRNRIAHSASEELL